MKRFFRKPGSVGQAPGTLVPIAGPEQHPLELILFEYGPEYDLQERHFKTIKGVFPFNKLAPVVWLNVNGTHQEEVVDKLGDVLALHPLTLEDIIDASQRPRIEIFDRYVFIELNMLLWDQELSQVTAEQVSLVLAGNYIVTFQERDGDVFGPVRKRIREGQSRVTRQGTDYLAYCLIDAIVDHYFIVLENMGEQIEFLEEELVTDPAPGTLQSIHELKRELIFLRKSVWPLREVIGALERGETPLFHDSTTIYLRDVYDHTIQVIDTVETFRDMVSGMLEIYLSSISNRMNEVMKVLTIISTLFIPLSFIVGLYGMNFRNMPELKWNWGYPMVWIVIISVVVGMLLYFRRKKWL